MGTKIPQVDFSALPRRTEADIEKYKQAAKRDEQQYWILEPWCRDELPKLSPRLQEAAIELVVWLECYASPDTSHDEIEYAQGAILDVLNDVLDFSAMAEEDGRIVLWTSHEKTATEFELDLETLMEELVARQDESWAKRTEQMNFIWALEGLAKKLRKKWGIRGKVEHGFT